ncbi:MAG TPA: NrfD/PsrC family molybdoenzyme membrane anchor subunit [Solirubrobacteraceae bacterium]|nr:NrfD/PsrC family molybdoenzyme membrane anchor subunit [Solirubrobacteraceae bacterium]
MSVWRDITPAVGVPGQPAFGEKTGEKVDLHIGVWQDGRWSYLYGEDTKYGAMPDLEAIRAASQKARTGPLPDQVAGPVIKAPVWTWEVPLYFWFGGIAAGSSFVALACDVAGDGRSAAVARKVALAALAPAPPLLVMDLGRPERFYNMLRIFKPRSPMSMGAWALTAFGNLAAAAVGADLLGRRRAARALGAANAVVGGYLGSYTGVLLASTAVPVWARSRLFLGPIFVSTATATGAAACRLALSATGLEPQHPTRVALANVETGAMAAELLLSTVNERRLGPLAGALEVGRPGKLFRAAKWAVRLGLAAQLARRRKPAFQHAASALYLAAGLLFRYAWVGAGPPSARDDRAVAETARSRRYGD